MSDLPDSRNQQKNQKIAFEAECLYEYFESEAINGCHEVLQEKIDNYLKENQLTDPSKYELSEIIDNVSHEWMIDEYSCKCRRYLNLK